MPHSTPRSQEGKRNKSHHRTADGPSVQNGAVSPSALITAMVVPLFDQTVTQHANISANYSANFNANISARNILSKKSVPNTAASECKPSLQVNMHEMVPNMFVPEKCPQEPVLKGSFCQDNQQCGASHNKQCAAISLTAVVKSKLLSVLTWTTAVLDGVLVKGTELYNLMRRLGKINDYVRGRNYIAIHELPRKLNFDGTLFTIKYGDTYTGFVNIDDYNIEICDVAMPLDVALQRTLLSNDGCLLTIHVPL